MGGLKTALATGAMMSLLGSIVGGSAAYADDYTPPLPTCAVSWTGTANTCRYTTTASSISYHASGAVVAPDVYVLVSVQDPQGGIRAHATVAISRLIPNGSQVYAGTLPAEPGDTVSVSIQEDCGGGFLCFRIGEAVAEASDA